MHFVLSASGAARGSGVQVFGARLMYLCWADDPWLLAQGVVELDCIGGRLEAAAFALHLGECRWARVQRQEDIPDLRPEAHHWNLRGAW